MQLSAFFAAEHAEVWAEGVAVPRHLAQPQACRPKPARERQQGPLKPGKGPPEGGREIVSGEHAAMLDKGGSTAMSSYAAT